MDYLFQGITDKVAVAQKLCDEIGIDLSQVAYIGDDIADVSLLKAVGFAATPAGSPIESLNICTLMLSKRGGEGVFREFVEKIFDGK